MNSVSLIGNLTKDPESIATKSGKSLTKFSIAVNGVKSEDDPTFVNITTFGPIAESCAKFLSKGQKVGVNGRLALDVFETKDGKKASSMYVIPFNVDFLTRKDETPKQQGSKSNGSMSQSGDMDDEDDVPF